MINVLVIGMTSTPGGVESFLVNYCYNKNMSDIHFDFLVISNEKVAYSDKLSISSNIFYVIPKSKNYFLHKKQIEEFFKSKRGTYSVVWANLNSLKNIDFLVAAKKYGIKHIIVHSHNSSNMGGKLQSILHNINKKRIDRIATDYWACSKGAAEWFYPHKLREHVRYVKNAINTKDYLFDESKRAKYRSMCSIDNCNVIGHIGRLHFQKNQSFLIDVFKEIVDEDKEYRLVLVGNGPDEQVLKDKVKELGIESNVLFLGSQADIGGWLSAFDVFVFPSVFEGLSIVGLEAQANGLPILASTNAISEEGMLNSNVYRMGLNEERKEWARRIKQVIIEDRLPAECILENFRSNGFEIDSEAAIMSKQFLDMA